MLSRAVSSAPVLQPTRIMRMTRGGNSPSCGNASLMLSPEIDLLSGALKSVRDHTIANDFLRWS